MKSLKELYEILLDYFSERHSDGICLAIEGCAGKGLIDWSEHNVLLKHFESSRPLFFHKEFYNPYFNSFGKTNYDKHFNGAYWWSLNDNGFERRKAFLKRQIKKLS